MPPPYNTSACTAFILVVKVQAMQAALFRLLWMANGVQMLLFIVRS